MDNSKVDELKLAAANFGFDGNTIADVLEKHGPEVLSWMIEIARNGVSTQVLVEIINRFGPWLLELLALWLNKKNMMAAQFAATGEVVTGTVVGVDTNFLDIIIQKYLPVILQQYLPMIFEKYGAQIIQVILDMLVRSLQK